MVESKFLINHVSNFFVESDSSFQILEDYFLNSCAIHDVTATDIPTFKFNLFNIINILSTILLCPDVHVDTEWSSPSL